jgi:hypothetical protein
MDHADHVVAVVGLNQRFSKWFPKMAVLQEAVNHCPGVNGLIMHLSFGHWDRGFESRSRHGCLYASFCILLFCVGRGLATG